MYKLIHNSGYILRNDGAIIPDDPGNADYRSYQDWVSKGNTPEPADVPPVFHEITPQATLVKVGDLANIAVSGAPDETVNIYIDGVVQAVELDENGNATISPTLDTAGVYIITDEHDNIVKVESYDVS
jgi:hypothetical protein